MDVFNIGPMCRICMSSKVKNSMSLFDKYKSVVIFDYINTITSVKIKENDGLPERICSICILELDAVITFKEKCEYSDTALQELCNSLKIKSDNNEVTIKKEEPSDLESECIDEALTGDAFLQPISKEEKSSDKIPLYSNVECHDCGSPFKSKCKLRVHWKQVHLPLALTCSSCKRKFKSYKAFNRHKTDQTNFCSRFSDSVVIHNEGKTRIFQCKLCSYKGKRPKDVEIHLRCHTKDKPHVCDLCGKAYTQHGSLFSHKETAHKQFKYETTCQYCGKFLKGRRNAYCHISTHKNNSIQCTICMKEFKNKKTLQVHLKRHTGIKTYTCEKCSASFYCSSDLANHMRKRHASGNSPKYYNCAFCKYKSLHKSRIKEHQAKHKINNIPCTICGMFFDDEDGLQKHSRKHFGERKFPCAYCEKRFLCSDQRRKHVHSVHKMKNQTTKKPQVAPIILQIKTEDVPVIKIVDA